MNFLELIVWMIKTFGSLANFFAGALTMEVPIIIGSGIGAVPVFTGLSLGALILSPATLLVIWAYQLFKAVAL
jgi:hypothetical protein